MDTIHYKEFGSGKLIYFIHGNSLNLESMIEFYEPFFETNQSFRRIYLDIPGMGDSYLKPSINNSDDILEETYSFILDHSNNKTSHCVDILMEDIYVWGWQPSFQILVIYSSPVLL